MKPIGYPRHVVLSHGWDATKDCGWLVFQCLRCGIEYKWQAVHKKLWEYKPPRKPGEKSRRIRRRYSREEVNFYAKYWRKGSGGVSVSDCIGCKPKKV